MQFGIYLSFGTEWCFKLLRTPSQNIQVALAYQYMLSVHSNIREQNFESSFKMFQFHMGSENYSLHGNWQWYFFLNVVHMYVFLTSMFSCMSPTLVFLPNIWTSSTVLYSRKQVPRYCFTFFFLFFFYIFFIRHAHISVCTKEQGRRKNITITFS